LPPFDATFPEFRRSFDEHLMTDLEVAENTVNRLGGSPARAFDRMIIAVEDEVWV
jgi:hypothetical protein